jgi:hypothetical protein
MIDALDRVYGSIGLAAKVVSEERLTLPALEDLDVGRCAYWKVTAEQQELFTHRVGVGPTDICVYFVRTTILATNGCAGHLQGTPSAVVSQSAPLWTLAHEVGHILGLDHVPDLTRLMTGAGTGRITRNPPDLAESERQIIIASPYVH